jgi:hypothetical protein
MCAWGIPSEFTCWKFYLSAISSVYMGESFFFLRGHCQPESFFSQFGPQSLMDTL